ncbi:hypothetical protein TCEL_00677 [Thermobrachium celere DSM 8682]|uniref:Uncharacterized protein n=1 Tax=Thermobrachium celere DSM 8682 TaxID=941824 RepID=R7RTB4_9CLOT|nr:hypothetical protein TCEL_00677 [Thermobrachium celere DSM 8682]
MARKAIGLSIATEEFGARFFANGARPGGILEHSNIVKALKGLGNLKKKYIKE